MKVSTTLFLLGFSAALIPSRLPAAEARLFEGVNLDELKQVQQLKDMPEIYERDPDNGGRFRLRRPAVQVPLGNAWLTFNPARSASYLNRVPGENAASYFGPIPGDAFEIFKLEERFTAALRKDYAGDVPHRLDLMLRTGDAKLRERALRIMTAGLAPDIGAEVRTYHVAKFKELTAAFEADDVAPLRAAITQTEQRIEELTVPLPDSDYQPGNDELARQGRLQDWMKPAGPVPDKAWGKPVQGLRAAAVFSTTRPKFEDEVAVWLLVENVGGREIRFGCSDVTQGAQIRVARPYQMALDVKTAWHTGLSPIQRYKLKPGERVTLAKKHVVFGASKSAGNPGFGGARVPHGPGEFLVHYESVLSTGTAWSRQDDGLMHRTLPAKGEWSGWLNTGETRFVIAGEPETAPAAPAATPAKREATGTKSILLKVRDAETKSPVPEFRVLTGVKYSAGRTGEPEVITWQPHTLRVGTDGALIWPLAKAYDQTAFRVEADGYAPQVFAWLDKKQPRDIDMQLTKDPGISGRVLLPDRKPAVGATVALAMVQCEVVLERGQIRQAEEPLPEKESDRWRRARLVQTDAEGRFQLPAENDPTAAVLIVHGAGVRELALAEFRKTPEVMLLPWGRIQGRAQWGEVAGSNRPVSLSIHRDSYGYPGVIAQYEKATTGADGSFSMERVLPGTTQFSCPFPVAGDGRSGITEVNMSGMTTHVTVQPGTNSVLLGGRGRTVLGRVVGRASWTGVTFHFHPTAPHIGFGGDEAMWSAWTAWQNSSLGPVFFRKGLKVDDKGGFEIPGVLPGNYQIFFSEPDGKRSVATGSFVVPAEQPGETPEPHAIGEFRSR